MKKKQLHIIYVPGLGDHKIAGQARAVKIWRKYGVHGHVLQMNWADGESWQPKFNRILSLVDRLAKEHDVAIVGVSAGGSAVINAFAARKDVLIGAVLIAGKVNRPYAVASSLQSRNPAFYESVHDAQAALASLEKEHRVRIQSRYSLADPYVPFKDSYIPGAQNKKVIAAGHFLTIASQITLGAPGFTRFLKQLQKQNTQT